VRRITYTELLHEVCRMANMLLSYGVRKGDRVAIYMPMVPEAAFAMLACARIGAVHSVVFAGFSAQALRSRVLDARAGYVITADENVRGGRHLPLKRTVDEAILGCPSVRHVFMYRHTKAQVPWHSQRDIDLRSTMDLQRPYCPAAEMDAEDPLFILYTSG
jgi:acetyl-CoA synthetase